MTLKSVTTMVSRLRFTSLCTHCYKATTLLRWRRMLS
ncbi:Uncharacterised protein [Vibrio cholerae]|nr:Uncharacterised protein [Vibrio cholerae]CSI63060.1 Uncharacterised protein [Vibrio cholerae]CSI64559.1 Uncharacterised protein [Vibrio cholerae]